MKNYQALKVWWRDWRRGYSEAEVESALAKIRAETHRGAVIVMTNGEMNACVRDSRVHEASWS